MNIPSQKIASLFPIFNTGTAISYIANSILRGMDSYGAAVELWVPASARAAVRSYTRNVAPVSMNAIAYRIAGESCINALNERRYLRALRPGDIAYIWPGCGPELCSQVKKLGATLLLERINCHTAVAKAILDKEASNAEMILDYQITDDAISRERADLQQADYVFAPSPLVAASLLTEGVPQKKILDCSYGWGTERITPSAKHERNAKSCGNGITILFVGLICMRKGVHRLIEAWKKSGLKGQLLLAGGVSKDFESRYHSDLNRSDIRLLGHCEEINQVYQSADLFAFPSFEEGSPLVSYEAMASGLPLVLSPMGAGSIARDGLEAIVIPPEETDAWAAAFRRLAADRELRAEMGRLAATRALDFTWEKCAARRLAKLHEALAAQ